MHVRRRCRRAAAALGYARYAFGVRSSGYAIGMALVSAQYRLELMREYPCERTRSVSVSDRNTTISSTSIGETNAITCAACRVLHVAWFMAFPCMLSAGPAPQPSSDGRYVANPESTKYRRQQYHSGRVSRCHNMS